MMHMSYQGDLRKNTVTYSSECSHSGKMPVSGQVKIRSPFQKSTERLVKKMATREWRRRKKSRSNFGTKIADHNRRSKSVPWCNTVKSKKFSGVINRNGRKETTIEKKSSNEFRTKEKKCLSKQIQNDFENL